MTTHRTPDELATLPTLRESQLICERLLGWQPCEIMGASGVVSWHTNGRILPTPSFDNWPEAGLILDALVKRGCDWDIESTHTDDGVKATVRVFFPLPNSASVRKCECLGTPFEAIRAAALAYIKAVKS